MTNKLLGIFLLSLMACSGVSNAANENNVTFIVTGNVRAELNLCG